MEIVRVTPQSSVVRIKYMHIKCLASEPTHLNHTPYNIINIVITDGESGNWFNFSGEQFDNRYSKA